MTQPIDTRTDAADAPPTPSPQVERFLAILREQLPALREKYHITELGLFGSYVRGEQRPDSDLDVLVAFEKTPAGFGFICLEQDLSDLLGVKVDLVPRRSLKPRLAPSILHDLVPVEGSGGSGNAAYTPAAAQRPYAPRQGTGLMPKRDYGVYLDDMLTNATRAEEFMRGVERSSFGQNELVVFAVVKALEIVGEAAKQVPEAIRARYPEVPWRQITGFRDRAVHAYFDIDLKVVWTIVHNEIPPLRATLTRILADRDKEAAP